MTLTEVAVLSSYYDLRNEIKKKKNISVDLTEMFDDEQQIVFENGKIQAYDQVLILLENRIKEMRETSHGRENK